MKRLFKSRILAVLLVLTVLASMVVVAPVAYAAAGSGTTYYVDSANGNDSNSGTDQAHPWQTLSKVNSTTFQPGDEILFHTEGSWQGQLHPLGSGTSGNPIVIDMYGGGSAKPAFDASGMTPSTNNSNFTSAVRLQDQQYWEINNLDVTNSGASAGDRRDVSVESTGMEINHVYIKNMYVHDVKGKLANSGRKRTGGIIVVGGGADTNGNPTTIFHDVRVEGNTIVNCDDVGMNICENNAVNAGSDTANDATNIVIEGNTVESAGGDAIIINMSLAPLVEHNVSINANARSGNYACAIWPWDCDGAILQYNEAYGTKTADSAHWNDDGTAWDSDAINVGTIYQYNYSHDNEGGSILICGDSDTQDAIVNDEGFSDSTVFRYNISQNDKGRIIYFCGPDKNTQIYNNTFYIGPTVQNAKIYSIEDNNGLNDGNYSYNNIFYNMGTGSSYALGTSTNNVFDYNVFYGNHPTSEPADAHKLTSDPMLMAPGTGGNGINTVDGYKLNANSPCIDSGKTIANNGGKDYFGNAVPSGGATDRGAYEATNLVRNPGFETTAYANYGEKNPNDWRTNDATYAVFTAAGDPNVHSGNQAYKISNKGATQLITANVAPGETYVLSGWGKTDPITTTPSALAIVLNSINTTTSVTSYIGELDYNSSSYEYKSKSFTVPAGVTNLQIYICENQAAQYTSDKTVFVYADDISLIKQPDLPLGISNLVTNPGFEQVTYSNGGGPANNWESFNLNYSTITTSAALAYAGTGEWCIGKTASGGQQIIADDTVTAGATYLLSALGKVDAGTGELAVGLKWVDTDDPNPADGNIHSIGEIDFNSTSYQYLSSSFVVPAGAVRLLVFMYGGGGTGYAYVDNVSLIKQSAPPQVAPQTPTGLTASMVSDSQINVTWNVSSGATGYDVEADGILYSNVARPFMFTGLTAQSTHQFKVRSKNGKAVSDWSDMVSEQSCKANIVPDPGFESGGLTSWDRALDYDTAGYAAVVSGQAHSGTYALSTGSDDPNAYGGQAQMIPVTGAGGKDYILSGWVKYSGDDVDGTFGIDCFNASDKKVLHSALEIKGDNSSTSYKQFIINITTPSDTTKFQIFTYMGDTTGYMYLDDVTLCEKPPVSMAPRGLAASVVASGTEIDVTWNTVSGASSYDLEANGVVHTGITGTSYADTGLTAGGTHTYRVRSIVDSVTSDWTTLIRITKGYGYTDNVAPSQSAPGGLAVSEVPQFVAFGFDDNTMSGWPGSSTEPGGLKFVTDLFKSKNVNFTFFGIGMAIGGTGSVDGWEEPAYDKKAWNYAMTNGNEIGDHTYNHAHGAAFNLTTWENELQNCLDWEIKPFNPDEVPTDVSDTRYGAGASSSQIAGFRAPYLEFNDTTYNALVEKGFLYDATITEGLETNQDGTNFFWPYTLNSGSPAKTAIGSHPGLWEMPDHVFIIPPDDKCAQYGITPGLRARVDAISDTFDPATGKVTGLDYNLWIEYQLNPAEFVGTLEYTLDLRLQGNRAPLLMGFHSDIYSDRYNGSIPQATAAQRRQALETFLDYALSKDVVRVTTYTNVINWLRKPVALDTESMTMPDTTYYVDSVSGNDSNSGTDQLHPWKTLDKVNNTRFLQGDKILFHTGESWVGQLHPLGSGIDGDPIVIDMYGGGTAKPAFDAGPVLTNPSTNATNYTSTVRLVDQEYWEINNLDVTNSGTPGYDRRGVSVESTGGTYNHIYIKNMYIHDVQGRLGSASGRKRTGGIIIVGEKNTDYLPTARYNDILVEGNTIVNCDNVGMNICENTGINLDTNIDNVNSSAATANDSTNVIIRNNVIDHPGGDGIIVNMCYAPLVEYNVCINANARGSAYACAIWPWDCDKAIFQYNEAYGTRMAPGTNGDATAWDSDAFNVGAIYQYNYSHDNDGGSFMVCGDAATQDVQGGTGFSDNTIFRYNISQNDHGTIVRLQGPNLDTHIYNNTFYVGSSVSNAEIYWSSNNRGNYSYNNIYYNEGTGTSFSLGSSTNNVFDYNVYYAKDPSKNSISNIPTDADALTSDPMLVDPGTGGIGINTVDGYKLQPDSPCIDSGMTIANNGGKDYWGNAVPAGCPTDRGAFEALNLAAPSGLAVPTGLKATVVTSGTSINVTWDSVSGATSYDLEIDGDVINGITGTSYEHTGLAAGSTHTYRVRTVKDSETSGWSASVSAKTPEAPKPAAPSGLAADASRTSINVTWHSVSDATSYELDIDGTVQPGITGTSYEHTGLTAGTTHTYRVRAVSDSGTSEWSAPVSATTTTPSVTPPATTPQPVQETKEPEISANTDGTKVMTVKAADSGSTAGKKEVSLSSSLISDALAKDVDKIVADTGIGTISIPMDVIASMTGKDITVSEEKLDVDSLPDNIRSVVGNNPVYDFNLFAGDTKVTSFGKAIEILLPYVPGTNEDTDKLTVFYINDNGELENVAGVYDAATHMIKFTTTHFSKYMVKENPVSFSDIGSAAWAKSSIESMAAKGIINGIGGSKFSPSSNVTRAQFAAMIVKAMKLTDASAENKFNDVSKDSWYYNAVMTAYKAGIISGKTSSTFAPNAEITRQEMAVMLAKAMQLKGKALPASTDSYLSGFSDSGRIANAYRGYVALVSEYKVISGMPDGTFSSDGLATRAQAATVIYKLFNLD